MFVFGHTGLTIAGARKVDPEVDARWAAALALGPDLIDKPASFLFPALANGNTRGIGHTALFSLLVLAALWAWKRRPKPALLLWACWIGHFLLDSMWRNDNPVILFWPLLGDFPQPVHVTLAERFSAWPIAWEIAGLILLIRSRRVF